MNKNGTEIIGRENITENKDMWNRNIHKRGIYIIKRYTKVNIILQEDLRGENIHG